MADPELKALLLDLVEDDADNHQDLKAYRKDLQKKEVKKLQQRKNADTTPTHIR